MKKKNFLLIAISTSMTTASFAQNTFPSNGNVGIGTNAPQEQLHVNGNVRIDSTLDISGNLNVGGNIQLSTVNAISTPRGNGILLTDGSGNLKKVPYDAMFGTLKSDLYAAPIPFNPCLFENSSDPSWSNGPNKIYVACPDVYVGVATNNPQTNLDVQGTTHTERLSINADPATMGSTRFHLKIDEGTPNNARVFVVENEERPLLQLNNNGLMRAREIKVNLEAAWPDYVFAPDYKLTPLSEVASFIKENGHLPSVPNAREVEQDGISLGEMNRILLEKIEELTIHLIEQQQLIETQTERIEALESAR